MARYEITAPGGERYEVEAPDSASEAQVMAYARSQFATKANSDEMRRKDKAYKAGGGAFGGMTNKLADTFTFGLADDAAGVAGVIGNAVAAPFSDKVDFDPRAAFNRGKGDFKDSITRAEQEAPAGSTLAGVLGFAGSVATPTRALAGVQSLRQAARTGLSQGAVTGAVAGVGASDGNVGERAASAGIGAAIGGGTGAALGVAIPVAGRIVGKAANAVRGMTGRGQSVAPRVISDALQADDIAPRAAGQMIDEAQARGVPLTLADMGDNLRGLASSVGRQPGPSRTIVRDMAIGRQEGQADRIAGAIARDLGPVANPREVSEQLIKKARMDSEPLYEAALNRGAAPVSGQFDSLLNRPSMRAALARAERIAAEEGRDPRALGFDYNISGEAVGVKKPSWQTLHYVKLGMDDVIEARRDPLTGRLKLDEEGRAINATQREFLATFDRLNKDYAAARAAYAGPAKMSTALAKGEKALSRTADDIVAMTRDMTKPELDQFRLGIRAEMTRAIESKGDYANKVQALVGTPKKRAALSQLFGGQGDFNRFLATLADEGRVAQTYRDVAGGSPTAPRLADDALTGDTGLIEAAGNALVVGVTGSPISAFINAIGQAKRYGVGEAGKVTRAEIAAALSETDPAVLREALRRALRDRARTRAGIRSRGTAGAQGRIGGQAAGGLVGLNAERQAAE